MRREATVEHSAERKAAPMARVSSARLRSFLVRDPAFIEPMECLAAAKLPDAPGWVWEIKLDGYHAT